MLPKKSPLIFAIYFLAACLACGNILLLDGWPLNHEGLSFFERVEVFRIAMQAGDFFPLWTPFAHNGYGSPFPFFYHRLYSTVIALIALLINSTYWSVKISIPLLLTCGAIGMHQTAKVMQLRPLSCIAAALLLIFANYTFTDWLIRGAVAEFSAFMLIPWLLYYGIKVIRGEPLSGIGLGLVTSLLFFAHSMIFYYAMLPIIVIFALSFWDGQNKFIFLKQSAINLLIFLGLLFVNISIYALAIILIKPEFNLDVLTTNFDISKQFTSFFDYLVYIKFDWGHTGGGYSVEIGRGITISLILTGIVIKILTKKSKSNLQTNQAKHKTWIFLILLTIIFVHLQFPLALLFYQLVPGAAYLQFPWRLLTFLTPILILLLCERLEFMATLENKLLTRQFCQLLLVCIVVHQIIFGINAQNIQYEVFSQKTIELALDKNNLAKSLIFGGEYLPQDLTAVPEIKPLIQTDNCQILDADPAIVLTEASHIQKISLTVQSNPSCQIYFNQFDNPFIKIIPGEGGSTSISEQKTIIVNPAPGVQKVEFLRQGLLQAIGTKILDFRF
ncbi:MAG: hypothetical protein F6J96_27825 [Symploca sp. SIO1C2]|nr:hypothetical protein [Symploca sp. SIO1C2]